MSDLVEASSVTVKTMADGTLRLSVDIEPRFARVAFGLFGSPGTPMALAALKSAAQADEKTVQQPMYGGPLCKWLAIRCKESDFHAWITSTETAPVSNGPFDEWAAEWVRKTLGVASRSDIDGDKGAEARFHELIRKPYSQWLSAMKSL